MNGRKYCQFSPGVSGFQRNFDFEKLKNICSYRYRYAKEAGGTSITKIPKNVYHDPTWKYSDESRSNSTKRVLIGKDGVGLEEDGVQRAIVEAAEPSLHVLRESSKFMVEKVWRYLHHSSITAEDYRTHPQFMKRLKLLLKKRSM